MRELVEVGAARMEIWLVWAELGYTQDLVRLEIWMGQAGLEI